jgi:DNA-directed RNA polymerase specialized sigma24 family protein
MFFEEPETQEVLSRIVAQVNSNPAWRDDLMQEGIIHLWRLEGERPNQSRSWYLQSCRFHLRHHMASGRSIDSWKHQDCLISFLPEVEGDEPECSLLDESITTAISEIDAKEILHMLRTRLTVSQQRVLGWLAEGFSSREIGLRLGVSHKAVLKQQHRIAAVARDLGIAPPPD